MALERKKPICVERGANFDIYFRIIVWIKVSSAISDVLAVLAAINTEGKNELRRRNIQQGN
jgi:hypothetical protein